MTTIARVAKAAGVGVGTVSRVLNGSASVSESTRRRVLDVIDELGYEPNPTARALSTGRTGAIGVVAAFFTQPSVTARLRGVSRQLAGAGYELILFDVESIEQRNAAFRSLIGRVDALLSISLVPSDDELERLVAARLPVVVIDQQHPSLPTITIDDVEGGRVATAHLLELGHERIAYAGDEEDTAYAFGFASSARRRSGYTCALLDAGYKPDPELVRAAPHGFEGGAAVGRELLALDEPPSAIFAASDTQALGVLQAAEALGVDVPRDLSVVGFDDIDVARYAGLTTVAQPLQDSGALGADLVLEALAGGTPAAVRLELELIVRGSTAEAGVAADLTRPPTGRGG
jgi:LacI family transcriptional regulator/LacI family repressor for deo operon, udp, cdd, tsx, nupC, and nupG